MKIGVHAQALIETQLSGIGYYTLHLLQSLARVDKDNEYTLFSKAPIAYPIQGEKFINYLAKPPFCFSYYGFPKAFASCDCDVAFLPKEVVPFGIKKPVVTTVFDLYYLKCSPDIRKKIAYKAWLHYFLAAHLHLPRASKIIAISNDTKKDLIEIAKIPEEKIIVTPIGYDPVLFSPKSIDRQNKVRQHYGIERPYFINTSSVWWERKNLLRLIEAFALVKKRAQVDHQLVITGKKGSLYNEMVSLIKESNLEQDIALLEYIPREHIPLLLQGASALVFPSLHEGFGLPIIEAMAMGCPVITSATSAMQEVGGEAALLVNPFNVEEIANAMQQIIQDPHLSKDLIGRGLKRVKDFSWDKAASATLQTLMSTVC